MDKLQGNIIARGERKATEPLTDVNPAYSKAMTTAVEMAINISPERNEVLRQLFFFLRCVIPNVSLLRQLLTLSELVLRD